MQVIARAGRLRTYNGSSVSPRERRDLELQYLREIAGKLELCRAKLQSIELESTLLWCGHTAMAESHASEMAVSPA